MKKEVKIGIAVGVYLFLIVLGGYWVWGFDFNERGDLALGCYCLALALLTFPILMGATYPND